MRRFVVWPMPAVATWVGAWVVCLGLSAAPIAPWCGPCVACAFGMGVAVAAGTVWRRVFVAAGFPLSFAATGSLAVLPTWIWLAPLALLAVVYPVRRWGDAPLFPTPGSALRGLSQIAPLPAGSRILDAGSGLGAALKALHAEYPQAALDGIEWSWLLCRASALRCRWARIRQGDIWTADWSGYDMVYLFQRPETMERALVKARRELRQGAWIASLEFVADGHRPTARHLCPDGRSIWLYEAQPSAAYP